MKKLIAVAGVGLALTGVGLGGLVTTAHAANGYRFCGSTDFRPGHWTYGTVTGASMSAWARYVSCHKARYVARHHYSWNSWHSANYNRSEYWRGQWYCWDRSTGYESSRGVCKASYGRRVKYAGGS